MKRTSKVHPTPPAPDPPAGGQSTRDPEEPRVSILKKNKNNSNVDPAITAEVLSRNPGSEHSQSVFQQNPFGQGQTLRAILPQIAEEQNRKTFGTWAREIDFTRTIIGYLLNMHNFFRFPFLCYKFGGVFFFPYVIMVLLVGVPVIFLEFTIGQFYGVNSFQAFTHMSPILSGVSKVLTWACVVNCWMYTVTLAWLRIYSSDSTSCLKGWEICHPNHFYNSPHCFTADLDDDCNDPSLANGKIYYNDNNESLLLANDMLFYNFKCRTVEYYCKTNNWLLVDGQNTCQDQQGVEHTIYERRFHATDEFFYGAVLGLQRRMHNTRRENLITELLAVTGISNLSIIRDKLFSEDNSKSHNGSRSVGDNEVTRAYLDDLEGSESESDKQQHDAVMDNVVNPKYQAGYWTNEGEELIEDPQSNSANELTNLSVTTWILLAVVLFEDLLKLSLMSYVLNGVPFMVLIYLTYTSVHFDHSGKGMEKLLTFRSGSAMDLLDPEMWQEAVIQAIYSCGIGNGVLISLSTFNNIHHNYLKDIFWSLGLSLVTSFCGVLICFCTLGHYTTDHGIDIGFWDYIQSQATTSSSIEFCFITYSHFLTLIHGQSVATFMFFYIITSFTSDTAIRLVQNVIDAVGASSQRLRHHNSMLILCVCFIGYLIQVPIIKNGAFLLFVDIEYFATNFMLPSIVLIELAAIVFVYKPIRIVDHAEQMNVIDKYIFRLIIICGLYTSFFIILVTIVFGIVTHNLDRFKFKDPNLSRELFGWVFCTSPAVMALLSVIKQLIIVPRNRWRWLFVPLVGKDQNVRRAVLKRVQHTPGRETGNNTDTEEEADHQEEIQQAASRWRDLESQLVLNVVARRREAKEKLKQASAAESGKVEKINPKINARRSTLEQASDEEGRPPVFAELVRIATSLKEEEEADNLEADEDVVVEGQQGKERTKRSAFALARKGGFFTKLKAAFIGKSTFHGSTYRPKRHVGGEGFSKLVTRLSNADDILNVTEEDDDDEDEEEEKHSDESFSDEEVETQAAKSAEKYLNMMDFIERWPGRLDDSEIESEASSIDESDSDVEQG